MNLNQIVIFDLYERTLSHAARQIGTEIYQQRNSADTKHRTNAESAL